MRTPCSTSRRAIRAATPEIARRRTRPGVFAFLSNIEGVHGFRLHAVRGFHGLNSRFELRMIARELVVLPIHLAQQIQLLALSRRVDLTVA